MQKNIIPTSNYGTQVCRKLVNNIVVVIIFDCYPTNRFTERRPTRNNYCKNDINYINILITYYAIIMDYDGKYII